MKRRVEVCLTVGMMALAAVSAGAAVDAPEPTRVIVRLRDSLDQTLALAPRARGGAVDLTAIAADGTPFVARHGVRRMKPLYPTRRRAGEAGAAESVRLAEQARRRFARRAARAPRGARLPGLTGTWVLDLGLRSRVQTEQALAALRADPNVLEVEKDVLARAVYVPNDPAYSSSGSWGQGYDDLYGLKRIGAESAWDRTQGENVVVAVIDTGVDATHPDLDANLWVNAREIAGNGLDDDSNGFIDDRRGWDFIGPTYSAPVSDNDPADGNGHGTHVAGTIAAEGDNHLGIVGVAWKARVMALKGLDDGGWGPVSGLANAIVYAADNGADVINASWGGEESAAVRDAVTYAHGLGVVFVAAAGNANKDAEGFFPARHVDAITVAAVDAADQKAAFSNFGSTIDVAAPGVDILSLERETGGYLRLDGTSMAAPHVSGVAALILAAYPDLTNEQVRQVLRTSATDIGAPGKDLLFGYGLVNAAAAVAAAGEALEARILSPAAGAPIHGPVALRGTVRGTGFDHYVVEVGSGDVPTSWTTIAVGSSAVVAGDLGTLDPSALGEGRCTVRVRAIAVSGRTYSDEIPLLVRYAHLSSPVHSDVPVLAYVHKSGAALDIRGTASGVGFVRYRIEWAPGRDATSGWSTAGVTLVGGGTAITDGLLGRWTPASTLSGEHTVRLVVEAAAVSTRSVTVYLEPDLVSTGWPQYIPNNSRTRHSPIPVRQANGRTKLVLGGASNEVLLFAPDGSPKKTLVVAQGGGDWMPSVGELDPSPGEEIVVTDGSSLRILSADLEPIRQIVSPRPEVFGLDMTSLADLDGDGALEIVTVARRTDEAIATLQVYRANGQLYSSAYPLTVFSAVEPNYVAEITPVAADLDGDLRKEIVFAVLDANGAYYTLGAVRDDGTPFAAWAGPTFDSQTLGPLVAADLDRDGRSEIIVHESHADGDRLRVVDGSGVTRPGWPRTFGVVPNSRGGATVGDLDRDGQEEIVYSIEGGIVILRPDGTESGRFTWPTAGPPGSSLIADVDGDGSPDIVTGYELVDFNAPVPFADIRLRVMSRTGALIKEWKLYGVEGWQAGPAVTAVGDFTGDGRTDFAVNQYLNENGGVVSGVMRVLTNNAPYNPKTADWPLLYHDAGHGRSKAAPRSTAKLAPEADAYVRGGSSASKNFGSAATLEVKKTGSESDNRIAYLRFPLAGVGRHVTAARLRIYGYRPTASSVVDSAFAVSSNTWSESGLTWNNKPAVGAKQGVGVVIGSEDQYYEWDVTAFVQAQSAAQAGAVSFAVGMEANTNNSPDSFRSREAGGSRPQLVVKSLP